jgi:hypothetical protein
VRLLFAHLQVNLKMIEQTDNGAHHGSLHQQPEGENCSR